MKRPWKKTFYLILLVKRQTQSTNLHNSTFYASNSKENWSRTKNYLNWDYFLINTLQLDSNNKSTKRHDGGKRFQRRFFSDFYLQLARNVIHKRTCKISLSGFQSEAQVPLGGSGDGCCWGHGDELKLCFKNNDDNRIPPYFRTCCMLFNRSFNYW